MTTPYRAELMILGLPSTPNARQHFYAKAKENTRWYQLVLAAVGNRKPAKPLEHAKLTLTRVSTVEPDNDNWVASFKKVIDGLRYAGVLVDDRKRNVGQPTYLWEKGQIRKGHVRIVIEEVIA